VAFVVQPDRNTITVFTQMDFRAILQKGYLVGRAPITVPLRELHMSQQPPVPSPDPDATPLSLYGVYLEDLGRIGSRHETARQFYITVITAIAAFFTISAKDNIFSPSAIWVGISSSIAAVAVCVLWFAHMTHGTRRGWIRR
jgi:hypothetical protein